MPGPTSQMIRREIIAYSNWDIFQYSTSPILIFCQRNNAKIILLISFSLLIITTIFLIPNRNFTKEKN